VVGTVRRLLHAPSFFLAKPRSMADRSVQTCTDYTSWAITIGLGDNVDAMHQPLLSVLVLSSARAHISSSVRTEQCRLRCNGRSISVYTVSVVFIRGRRRADSDVAAAWTSVVAMQTWTPSSTCRHGRPSSLRAGQTPVFSRAARGRRRGTLPARPVGARRGSSDALVHRDRRRGTPVAARNPSIRTVFVFEAYRQRCVTDDRFAGG
jgi:hypothetical protein